MKRDEQACTAVPFHDGLAEHLTQIARIIHTELRKVLAMKTFPRWNPV